MRKPLGYVGRQRLARIERTLRHAEATRPDPIDSWLNAYQSDVRWLVERLKEREPNSQPQTREAKV